jgi:hypothetical protein
MTRFDLACAGTQHCWLPTLHLNFVKHTYHRQDYPSGNFTLGWNRNDLHTFHECAVAPALDGHDNTKLVNHTSTNISWFSSRLIYRIKTAHFGIYTIPFLSPQKTDKQYYSQLAVTKLSSYLGSNNRICSEYETYTAAAPQDANSPLCLNGASGRKIHSLHINPNCMRSTEHWFTVHTRGILLQYNVPQTQLSQPLMQRLRAAETYNIMGVEWYIMCTTQKSIISAFHIKK